MTEKRLNYFDTQFLRATDFDAEQEYHIDRRRRHNKHLHTSGIADGLNVSVVAGTFDINVSEGTAIDVDGREIIIVIPRSYTFTPSQGPTAYLTIAYFEQDSDFSDELGIAGDTRTHELAVISASGTPPGALDNALLLATITIDTNGVVDVSHESRRLAGIQSGDLEVTSLILTAEGIEPAQWPTLRLGVNDESEVRTDLVGSLRISGDLILDGEVRSSGSVGEADIADEAVTSLKISDNAVQTRHIAAGSVTESAIANASVGNSELADNAITAAKIATNAVGASEIMNAAVGTTELATNAVTAVKLASSAVTASKIASNAVTSSKVANNAITAEKIAPNAVGADEIISASVGASELADNAVTAAKIASNSVGSSEISSAAVGTSELMDNSVTAAKIAVNAVGSSEIAAGAVGSSEISENAVGSSEIAAGAVGVSEIANDAVTAAKIANNAVGAAEIMSSAVGTSELMDSSVTAAKIAADAVGSSEIAANAVGTSEIATDAVTAAKIAVNAVGSSEIAANAVGTSEIINNAVTAAKIAADAVGTSEIAANAVGTSEIATDAVTAAKIAVNAVGSSEIAANAVGASEIAANAVGTSEIINNAVTAAKIAADAVGSSEIAANAVGSSEIATDAVTAAKIAANAVGASEIAANAVGTSEIINNAVTAAKIAASAVGASEIASNAVGASELANNAVANVHLQSNAVTNAKVANNSLLHSRLNFNDGSNPHGTSASDVNALSLNGGVVNGTLQVRNGSTSPPTQVDGVNISQLGIQGAVSGSQNFRMGNFYSSMSRTSFSASSNIDFGLTYDRSSTVAGVSMSRTDVAGMHVTVDAQNNRGGLSSAQILTLRNAIAQEIVGMPYNSIPVGNDPVDVRLLVRETADLQATYYNSVNTYGGKFVVDSNSSNGLVGSNYGVYAEVTGNMPGEWAGYFNGDVHVTGDLTKSSGSFLIDHPDDPANKTLRHNFVESPEHLCLYRGKVLTDENGEAVVTLPDYFAKLTKEDEATVTLTPIGRKPFLAGYEWNDTFTEFSIFGDPDREVSYIVLVDRDDPAIRLRRKPVEQLKGAGNFMRGEFLDPKAYADLEEKDVPDQSD